MTDQLEALIRRAQDERARLAPDPDRVRRALPALTARRQRRHRTRLVASAALAVLAVVVSAALLPNRTPSPPTGPPTTGPTTAPAVPVLTLRPTWLPSGFRETIRVGHVTADEAIATRTWTARPMGVGRTLTGPSMTAAPAGPSISLGVRRLDRQAPPPGGTPVDVNGVTGTYLETKDSSSVVWAVDATHLASIQASGVPRADLLHVATSVRPDGTGFPPPLRLDWLPGQTAELHYSLSGDRPIDWNATLIADVEGLGTFTVMLAPTTDAPDGGEAVPVGTIMGRIIEDTEPRQIVVVQPPSSRYILTVWFAGMSGSTLDRDALLRLVARVDADIRADTEWIGG